MAETLPKRSNPRPAGCDYSLAGGYFVTICASGRGEGFGAVEEGEVVLNDSGKMLQQCWREIPEHFPAVTTNEYIILPDHFHGIIFITEIDVGATHTSPLRNKDQKKQTALGTIIGSFKSAASKKLYRCRLAPGQKLWQRGYFDRINRYEDESNRIRDYLLHNAIKQAGPEFISEANYEA
jgi:putative transposase